MKSSPMGDRKSPSISLLLSIGDEMKYHPLVLILSLLKHIYFLFLFSFSSIFLKKKKTAVNLLHDIMSDMQQQTSFS